MSDNEKKKEYKMFDELHTKKKGVNMTVLKYALYLLLFNLDQDLPKS